MNKKNNNKLPIEIENISRLFERRRKIIEFNNNSILEITIFYENFFLFRIIQNVFFNENFEKNHKFKKFIIERMNFIDKYNVIKELAQKNGIEPVSISEFDFFIKTRNNIAHNLSSVDTYNSETTETTLVFGGESTTWEEYLKTIQKWSDITLKLANFTRNVFKATCNSEDIFTCFRYCKIMGNCALIQHNLLLEEPDGEYTFFAKNGIDSELLQYLHEENNLLDKK